MIESLTPEQEAQIPVYRNKYIEIGLDTTRINYDQVVDRLKKIYSLLQLPEPVFFGPFDSPIEANRAIAYVKTVEKPVNEDVVKVAHDPNINLVIENNQFFTGQHEAFWVSFYAYFQEVVGIKYDKEALFNEIKELIKISGWICLFENAAFIVQKPSIVKVEGGQRHSLDGPAIAFESKFFPPIYAVHGVNVTKEIIEGNFTWKDIESQQNAEVRRVMINKYGQERYIIDSGLKPIHQDDWGTLYEKVFPDDPEPLRVVKVVNSTPEPDGTYKDYFHRVDPKAYGGVKIAHAAVASLWRNKEDGSFRFKDYREYHPLMES
jgi:hypothetical protein